MPRQFRLLGPVAIPGWVLMVWTMLAYASTAQFALMIAGKVSRFLADRFWWAFWSASLWLAVVVYFPEIKRALWPARKAPPLTVDQKLENIDARLASIETSLADLPTRNLRLLDATRLLWELAEILEPNVQIDAGGQGLSEDMVRAPLERHLKHLQQFALLWGKEMSTGELLNYVGRADILRVTPDKVSCNGAGSLQYASQFTGGRFQGQGMTLIAQWC